MGTYLEVKESNDRSWLLEVAEVGRSLCSKVEYTDVEKNGEGRENENK